MATAREYQSEVMLYDMIRAQSDELHNLVAHAGCNSDFSASID